MNRTEYFLSMMNESVSSLTEQETAVKRLMTMAKNAGKSLSPDRAKELIVKAEKIAKDAGREGNWGYITGILKRMLGLKPVTEDSFDCWGAWCESTMCQMAADSYAREHRGESLYTLLSRNEIPVAFTHHEARSGNFDRAAIRGRSPLIINGAFDYSGNPLHTKSRFYGASYIEIITSEQNLRNMETAGERPTPAGELERNFPSEMGGGTKFYYYAKAQDAMVALGLDESSAELNESAVGRETRDNTGLFFDQKAYGDLIVNRIRQQVPVAYHLRDAKDGIFPQRLASHSEVVLLCAYDASGNRISMRGRMYGIAFVEVFTARANVSGDTSELSIDPNIRIPARSGQMRDPVSVYVPLRDIMYATGLNEAELLNEETEYAKEKKRIRQWYAKERDQLRFRHEIEEKQFFARRAKALGISISALRSNPKYRDEAKKEREKMWKRHSEQMRQVEDLYRGKVAVLRKKYKVKTWESLDEGQGDSLEEGLFGDALEWGAESVSEIIGWIGRRVAAVSALVWNTANVILYATGVKQATAEAYIQGTEARVRALRELGLQEGVPFTLREDIMDELMGPFAPIFKKYDLSPSGGRFWQETAKGGQYNVSKQILPLHSAYVSMSVMVRLPGAKSGPEGGYVSLSRFSRSSSGTESAWDVRILRASPDDVEKAILQAEREIQRANKEMNQERTAPSGANAVSQEALQTAIREVAENVGAELADKSMDQAVSGQVGSEDPKQRAIIHLVMAARAADDELDQVVLAVAPSGRFGDMLRKDEKVRNTVKAFFLQRIVERVQALRIDEQRPITSFIAGTAQKDIAALLDAHDTTYNVYADPMFYQEAKYALGDLGIDMGTRLPNDTVVVSVFRRLLRRGQAKTFWFFMNTDRVLDYVLSVSMDYAPSTYNETGRLHEHLERIMGHLDQRRKRVFGAVVVGLPHRAFGETDIGLGVPGGFEAAEAFMADSFFEASKKIAQVRRSPRSEFIGLYVLPDRGAPIVVKGTGPVAKL